MKAFSLTLLTVHDSAQLNRKTIITPSQTSFPGPFPYLECGTGKDPGIGWSRAYLNIHKNNNVWIPVVNSAFWLVDKISLELNILGKVRV